MKRKPVGAVNVCSTWRAVKGDSLGSSQMLTVADWPGFSVGTASCVTASGSPGMTTSQPTPRRGTERGAPGTYRVARYAAGVVAYRAVRADQRAVSD